MNRSRAAELVASFRDKRILVIGDLMLDEFLWGKVARISPEAPVPVVDVVREEFFPGGAANVARNIAEFASGTALLGVTGTCRYARKLSELLVSEGIDVSSVQTHPEYQTIVKTRVIARHQHVVRIDREVKTCLTTEHAAQAVRILENLLPSLDGVIIEDYGKGLLTPDFTRLICTAVRRAGKILAVDPNPKNPIEWDGLTVIKPNRLEAFAAAGIPYEEPADDPMQDTALQQVADVLMRKWKTENLLITLGEQGVLLVGSDGSRHHAPTRAREVFDVSGAGDTVIAVFTLALAAGVTPAEAAEIANHASGIVVGKLGTATVKPAELLESFEA
jgi:D-beta-D-heptose 7-phosphate kinase/D-beta-D-heptose 1-phosphate adenosyltransferase